MEYTIRSQHVFNVQTSTITIKLRGSQQVEQEVVLMDSEMPFIFFNTVYIYVYLSKQRAAELLCCF